MLPSCLRAQLPRRVYAAADHTVTVVTRADYWRLIAENKLAHQPDLRVVKINHNDDSTFVTIYERARVIANARIVYHRDSADDLRPELRMRACYDKYCKFARSVEAAYGCPLRKVYGFNSSPPSCPLMRAYVSLSTYWMNVDFDHRRLARLTLAGCGHRNNVSLTAEGLEFVKLMHCNYALFSGQIAEFVIKAAPTVLIAPRYQRLQVNTCRVREADSELAKALSVPCKRRIVDN
jgi:hypothetical protein